MVWTIAINENGGIDFDNGSLRMVGTKGEIDKDEKIQSLRLRFLTQLGENNWALEDGFDYQGIFSQVPAPNEGLPITKKEVTEVNAVKTVAQDPQISPFINYINATVNDADRVGTLDLSVRAVDGTEINSEFKLGGAIFV